MADGELNLCVFGENVIYKVIADEWLRTADGWLRTVLLFWNETAVLYLYLYSIICSLWGQYVLYLIVTVTALLYLVLYCDCCTVGQCS